MSENEAAPARPKAKTSGLTILLAVIGGGFLVIVAVLAIVAWRVMASPEGRAIVGVVGDTMKIVQKAQKAPGTRELRGAGCKTAMVLELEDLAKIVERFDASRPSESPFGSMVACGVQPWGSPPACDDLAKTYVGAVGPRPKPFLVSVTKSGQQKPLCSTLYDGEGARTQDFDDPAANRALSPPGE